MGVLIAAYYPWNISGACSHLLLPNLFRRKLCHVCRKDNVERGEPVCFQQSQFLKKEIIRDEEVAETPDKNTNMERAAHLDPPRQSPTIETGYRATG